MIANDKSSRSRLAKIKSSTALAALFLAGCASQQTAEPPQSLALTPNASWFECHARFDCVIVYDSNVCAQRAVNARHAIEYESWARGFLERAGESRDCAPDPDAEPRGVCRDSRCEIAESNLEALIEYTR